MLCAVAVFFCVEPCSFQFDAHHIYIGTNKWSGKVTSCKKWVCFYANVHISIDIMRLTDTLAVYDGNVLFPWATHQLKFVCVCIQRVLYFFFWKSHCHWKIHSHTHTNTHAHSKNHKFAVAVQRNESVISLNKALLLSFQTGSIMRKLMDVYLFA